MFVVILGGRYVYFIDVETVIKNRRSGVGFDVKWLGS